MTRGTDSPASTPSTLAPDVPGEIMPMVVHGAPSSVADIRVLLQQILSDRTPVVILIGTSCLAHAATGGASQERLPSSTQMPVRTEDVVSAAAHVTSSDDVQLPLRRPGEPPTDYAIRIAREIPDRVYPLKTWRERTGVPVKELERAIAAKALPYEPKSDGRDHGLKQVSPPAFATYITTVDAVRAKRERKPRWWAAVHGRRHRSARGRS